MGPIVALRDVVRQQVTNLDDGGMSAVPGVIAALRSAGVVPGIHVRKADATKVDLTPEQTVEWYAGQVLSILESENWFAVNSIVNALDRFVPEQTV